MIRNIVRNILLETRGPLAFIPILKEWISVAAEYGKSDDPYIKGPSGRHRAQNASLKVPRVHAGKVFDNCSPDLQEYILKHWRSEEYFAAMIEGVTLGIVRSYEQSNYAGMKSGTTTIQGGINEEGEMVGSMSGYLTARMEENVNWQSDSRNSNRKSLLDFNGNIVRDNWKKMLLDELKKRSGSTMVHEFQHWFQESVYYPQKAIMKPTKRKGKRNELPEPRKAKPNLMNLKPIQLMLAKEFLEGIDWSTTMQIRGATAYKLDDPEAFFTSYNKQNPDGRMEYINVTKEAFQDLSQKDTRDLLQVLMYDYLKLQKDLDSDDLDKLASQLVSGNHSNLRSATQRVLWDKGKEIATYINHQNSYGVTDHKEKLSTQDKNRRDTPKGSGEKTVQGTDSLLKSLGSSGQVNILKSTDFDKKGNLKKGRQPSNPTPAGIEKATWVILSQGTQKVPRRAASSSEWAMEKERGTKSPGYGRGEWTERWVEFDAVVSEYMVAEVLSVFENRHYTVKFLLKGQSKKFAEWLGKQVAAKVGARGFDHVRRKEINRKHIQSLADRITDRLIETIEENPYEDFYDLNPNGSNKGNDMAILPIRKFDAWVTSDSFANSKTAPYGTAGYWKWIFAKATGENV